MAAFLLQEHPDAAKPVFDLADEILGPGVTELCVSGSAEELRRTDVTQPAVLATSLALWAVLTERGFRPALVAGHSLGEYAALTAAGVLSPASALALSQCRGRLMAAVAEHAAGAMLAIVGLDGPAVEQLCRLASDTAAGTVEPAGYNTPEQTVVSGHEAAVAETGRLALAAGARKVVPLGVGAAFHCSLMAEIAAQFEAELHRHPFDPPRIPVLSTVSGDFVAEPDEIRALLALQLTAPVRWSQALAAAEAFGCGELVEVGPGRVLAGFAKEAAPGLEVRTTGTAPALDTLLRRFAQQQNAERTTRHQEESE